MKGLCILGSTGSVGRNTLLGIAAAAVVVAALGGYVVGYRRGSEAASARTGRPEVPIAAVPMAPVPGPGAAGPGGEAVATLARIDATRGYLAAHPIDRKAWVQLGNDYFDTHQRDRAIEAYAKALELGPDDPDVLTDQGIMYRETGKFDQAIANFEKANRIDPRHLQSLFNLGVVHAYDRKDRDRALATWKRLIALAPASPQAAQARQAMAELGIAAPP